MHKAKIPPTIHVISSLRRQGYAKTLAEAIETNKKIIELNKNSLKKLEDELQDLENILKVIEEERKTLSKKRIHVFEDETKEFWDQYWLKKIK